MKLQVNWDEAFVQQQDILRIRTQDLDAFYAASDDVQRTGLFFVLLNSLHMCLAQEQRRQAAHLSFLMAYYVFVPLAPPGADALARHYMEQAMQLYPSEEYAEWIPLMRETERHQQ